MPFRRPPQPTRHASLVLLAGLVAMLALAGCRSQPMVRPTPLMAPLGEQANRQAILRGLAAHRWAVVDDQPGRITARFDKKNVGRHVAIVDVLYDADRIEIRYRDSHGLRCEPADAPCETIHRAYNRWVVQLSRDIEYGVQMVQMEQLADRPHRSGGPDRPVGAGPDE